MSVRRVLLVAAAAAAAAGLGYVAFLWIELRGAADDLRRLAAELDVRPGMTVAEIGAGRGAWTLEVARLVGPHGHVFSTELDPRRLRQLQDAVVSAGLRNVTVLEAAPAETRLPAGCCDAVFLRTVYHHLTVPYAINDDLLRALRPGGTIGIVDFEPIPGSRWIVGVGPRLPLGVPAPRGGHGVRMRDVEGELRAAGFEMVRGVPRWSRGLYLVAARKPEGAAAPSLPTLRP